MTWPAELVGSTKLVHGGLRYLDITSFRAGSEALIEREILWKSRPTSSGRFRFVLPHHDGLRPAGCCGSVFFCMTISAAGICCRRRARSI